MSNKKKSILKGAGHKGAVGDINVTPLIDVVLVLLIIYMVVTPIMLNQLKIEMPEKEEEVPEDELEDRDQVLVAACLDEQEKTVYRLNQNLIEKDQITKEVREILSKQISKGALKNKEKKQKQGIAFVYGHPEVRYPEVILLMDMINNAAQQIGENTEVKIGIAELKLDEKLTPCTEKKKIAAQPTAPVQQPPTEGG